MHLQFTEKQQKTIDRLYRKEQWPIKAIARHLQVSDKRVSAFLRGEEMKAVDETKGCKCKEKKGKKKDKFSHMVDMTVQDFNESLCECSSTILNMIYDCIIDVLDNKKKLSKKEIQKITDKRLEKLYDSIGSAVFSAAMAVIFTMPSVFKRLWIEKVDEDPKVYHKKGKK